MKKIAIIFFALIAGVTICFAYGAKSDDKQVAITDDEMVAILSKNDIKLQKEFAPLTKEIENKLFGEWVVQDTLGYTIQKL